MSDHPPTLAHGLHLVRRAVGSLRAAALSPREASEVAGLLDEPLAALFWEQPIADQRHGIDAAHYVLRARHGDRMAAAAALLHDVGKRRARLGFAGRVAATLLALVRLPAPGRLGIYLDHAAIGAADLEAAGADSLAVAYARHQDDPHPPQAVPLAVWAVLKEADGEKHRLARGSQYDGG